MEDPILKEAKQTLEELKSSLGNLGNISNNIGKIDSYIAGSKEIVLISEKLVINLQNALEGLKREYVSQSNKIQEMSIQLKKDSFDLGSKTQDQIKKFSYLLYLVIALSLVNIFLKFMN